MKQPESTGILCVITTADTKKLAQNIANELVRLQLAACVQVEGPIASTYWWQGKIEQAEEWRCVAKTTLAAYNAVEDTIRNAHTYDEPEIVAVEVAAGSDGYLDWLRTVIQNRS